MYAEVRHLESFSVISYAIQGENRYLLLLKILFEYHLDHTLIWARRK